MKKPKALKMRLIPSNALYLLVLLQLLLLLQPLTDDVSPQSFPGGPGHLGPFDHDARHLLDDFFHLGKRQMIGRLKIKYYKSH